MDQNGPFPKSEHREGSGRCGTGAVGRAGKQSLSQCLRPGPARNKVLGHHLWSTCCLWSLLAAQSRWRPGRTCWDICLVHPAAVRSRKGLRGTSGSSSFLLALRVPPSDQVRLAGSFGSFGPGHEGSTLPSGTSFFQLTPISHISHGKEGTGQAGSWGGDKPETSH